MIRKEAVVEICTHARECYPHECCGILVGKVEGRKEAIQVRRLTNAALENPRVRYALDPREMLSSDRWAREAGMEMVGFYHSHPDHSPYPSQLDAEGAWPWYSYLIVSVLKGQETSIKSWVWDESRGEFEEEPLEVV